MWSAQKTRHLHGRLALHRVAGWYYGATANHCPTTIRVQHHTDIAVCHNKIMPKLILELEISVCPCIDVVDRFLQAKREARKKYAPKIITRVKYSG